MPGESCKPAESMVDCEDDEPARANDNDGALDGPTVHADVEITDAALIDEMLECRH